MILFTDLAGKITKKVQKEESSDPVFLKETGPKQLPAFPKNRIVLIILNPLLRRAFKIGTVVYLISSERVALMKPCSLQGN